MLNDSPLFKTLVKPGHVFLIQQDDPSQNQQNIDAAFKQLNFAVYNLSAKQITKPGLLELWSESNANLSPSFTRGSYYLLICENMLRLGKGVIYIQDAQKLTNEARRLLAQLIRFAVQKNLKWRLVLSVPKSYKKNYELNVIGIDHFYPKIAGANTRTLAGKSVSQPWLKTAVYVSLLLLSLAALYQFFIATPETLTQPTTSSPLPTVSVNNQQTEQIETPDTDLNEYLKALEERDRLFEQELARLKNDASAIQTQASSVVERPGQQRASNRKLPPDVLTAISQGNLKQIQAMTNAGETFNGQGNNGQNPLIISVMANQEEVLNYLLTKNLAVDQTDNFGRSALYYAAIEGDLPMVQALVNAGAKINARNDLNKTPVMAAVHNGHYATTEYLLNNGALPDLQDHSGWSALFYAVWGNRQDLVDLLESKGASNNIRDKDGYSLSNIKSIRPITEN